MYQLSDQTVLDNGELLDYSKGTSCKTCVMAEYADNTQTGCKMGMLDNLRNAGVTVIDMFDMQKEFYFVKDRRCVSYRSQDWAKNYQEDQWYFQVKKEIQVRYDLIIFARQTPLEKILFTLDGAAIQYIKPENVHILIDSVKPSQLIPKLEAYDLNWKISLLTENITEWLAVNDVVKPSKSTFYCLWEAGTFMPRDYSKKLNSLVNEKMRQFSVIEPKDKISGTTVQVLLHNLLGGNADIGVIERIKNLAEPQSKHMILNWDELWQ